MKRKIALLTTGLFLFIIHSIAGNTSGNSTDGSVVVMTNDLFKQKIFNYETNKTWKYQGTQPVIIDFYATWCGPCKMLSPIVEEVAKKYAGKIVVYKVDTDKEQKLSGSLGISSLPTLLFIPVKGQPQASMGYIPRETLEKAINEVLFK